MRLSTRGRYAVRSLVDLAQYMDNGFVSLQSISKRQEISLHYLEQIFHKLKKKGIVESKKGLGGGYVLSREPKDITIGDVVRAVEGPIAPVKCVLCEDVKDKGACMRMDDCKTRPLWKNLGDHIETFLDSVTLMELINGYEENAETA